MSDHSHPSYVKTWVILLVLLMVSLVGPELGIKWVTLITAFGIAGVKAWLVCTRFMHLNIEKRFVVYMLVGMIGFSVLFFYGTAGDVMNHEGQNWSNTAAKAEVKRAQAAQAAAAHDHAHSADHAHGEHAHPAHGEKAHH